MKIFRSARDIVNLKRGRNDWYRIDNTDKSTATIHIYDEIGYFGITAKDFVAELSAVKTDRIELHLNSPGGDVFDGIAIYNSLKQHSANVHVIVDSLAASIASVIAMSGDTVTIARNGTFMAHDGFAMTIGNAADMRTMADLLDKTSDNIASIYADRTGKSTEHWREIMRAETWFNADESVAAGLADEVQGDGGAGNSWDLSIFNASVDESPPSSENEQPDQLAWSDADSDEIIRALKGVHSG